MIGLISASRAVVRLHAPEPAAEQLDRCSGAASAMAASIASGSGGSRRKHGTHGTSPEWDKLPERTHPQILALLDRASDIALGHLAS